MQESQALLRLQDIDIELMRLNGQLKAMPQQKKLAAIIAAKKNLAGKLKAIVGQRKDAEIDLEDNEAAHEKTVNRINEVQAEAVERGQDFRGIRDLEAHLTALAKQLEKIEFKHIELESNLEKLMKAEQNARDLDAKLDAERAAQKESFDQASSNIMASVRQLAVERKAVLADISDEVAEAYAKAAKRFGGLAVERLRGNMPTTCRVKLQQGIFGELMRGPIITECPYCHRMLVTEGALADE
jgi:predicted  nucleic acid-binding Zn-ribbon protein